VEDVDLIDAEDVVSGALGLLVDRGSPARGVGKRVMLVRDEPATLLLAESDSERESAEVRDPSLTDRRS
jgi:hypothetical protein